MNFWQKKWSYTRKAFVLASCVVAMVGLVSCNSETTQTPDILSQKPADARRTQITVLVKFAFSIHGFEEAVEEKFPNIDIVQVGNYSRDMGIMEYERRLEHDDLPDIVMTWPLEVGMEYWEDRLMDLSGMDFTNRYNISMLNDIAKDGKLYYLPGPSQIRGIVYNKTMFQENGWQVPDDFEGFIELCKTIEASGMRSLQLGFANAEVLETAFVGYNFANYFSTPEDVQWLTDYNEGKGSFEHFDLALDVFQRMIDEGIWKPTDLEVGYATRESMLFTRQCAMVEDSVLMTRMGYQRTGNTDEFALMPFFNQGKDGDWARLYMVCYIGLNKHLTEPKNKEKHQLVMELMDYISTPEGQKILGMDTDAMFSSLTGVEPPDAKEIEDMLSTLSQGRYSPFPKFNNVQAALREGLKNMVLGKMTKEEVIHMVDEQNKLPPALESPEIFGTAEKSFTLIETGNYLTDAMRAWSGSEIALFLDNGKDGRYNGNGLKGKLYQGDITATDILAIMPVFEQKERGTLWNITMTGADLIHTLEHSIIVNNNQTGWFYYFSGLAMTYDPKAEPGTRIHKIMTEDGKPIDEAKLYTIAIMDQTVPEECIKDCEKTDTTMIEILEQSIKKSGSITPSTDGRFTVPK